MSIVFLGVSLTSMNLAARTTWAWQLPRRWQMLALRAEFRFPLSAFRFPLYFPLLPLWKPARVSLIRHMLVRIQTARSRHQWMTLLCCLPFLLARPTTEAADEFDFFEKRIRPVLVEHCYRCHSASADKLKGDLRLDTRDGLRQGGKS